MRQLSFVILVAIEVLVLALGINGLIQTWSVPVPVQPVFAWLPEAGGLWTLRIGWLTVALLPLVHAALFCWIVHRERSIVIRTSSSESLSLYQTAIVQYVRNSIGEVPAVLNHRVRVRPAGRGLLAVTASVTLRPVENIPKVQAEIEATVRRKLTELLGVEKIHKIKVVVKNFGSLESRLAEAGSSTTQLGPESAESEPADAEKAVAETHAPEPVVVDSTPQEVTLPPRPAGENPTDAAPPSDPDLESERARSES